MAFTIQLQRRNSHDRIARSVLSADGTLSLTGCGGLLCDKSHTAFTAFNAITIKYITVSEKSQLRELLLILLFRIFLCADSFASADKSSNAENDSICQHKGNKLRIC